MFNKKESLAPAKNEHGTTISSLVIAQVAGRNHRDVLRSIRDMEPAWEKFTERKFALSEYADSTGRKLPMYSLSKTEYLYVIAQFNNEIRAKLVLRWEELEKDRLRVADYADKSDSKDGYLYYAHSCRRLGLSVDSGAYWRRIQRYPNEFQHDEAGRTLISESLFFHLKRNAELTKEREAISARNPKYIGANTQAKQLSLYDEGLIVEAFAEMLKIEDKDLRTTIFEKVKGGLGL